MTGHPHAALVETGTVGRDTKRRTKGTAYREEANSIGSWDQTFDRSAESELDRRTERESELTKSEGSEEEELDSKDSQGESDVGFKEIEEETDSGSEESQEAESDLESEDNEESESGSETGESEIEEKYGLSHWKEGPVNRSSPALLVRANKRLVELVVDGRHAMEGLPSWSSMWSSVQELDRWLNRCHSSGRLKSLGLFLPILSRLFDDVDRYIYQPVTNSKDYRQVLDRPEAKALTVMQQKWPKLCKQEMHVELRALIQRHSIPKPQTIVGAHDLPTRKVLDSLERVLLYLTNRMAVCNLRMAELPAALLDLETITSWYTSFGPIFGSPSSGPLAPQLERLSADTIGSIKYLDVSRNELTEIPQRLTSVFSQLWKLDLTRNPLDCLPMSLWEWERGRLRVDPLKHRPTGRHRLGSILARASDPPTLVESCLSRLIKNAVPTPRAPLPPRLIAALARGRLCDHCLRFRWSAQKALYLRGLPRRVIYRSDGSRQKSHPLIFGPSFLCPACLHLHTIHQPASSH